MNFFLTCTTCHLVLLLTKDHSNCPFCNSLIDRTNAISIDFDVILKDIKAKEILNSNDIMILFHAIEFLTTFNEKLASELGIALLSNHRLKERVEWYRKNSLKII